MWLNTFDILLCSGTPLLSRIIRRTNRIMGYTKAESKISHVAMIYQENESLPFVFESTSLNKWSGKDGVQLNPFSKWITNYPGRVWVRNLFHNKPPIPIENIAKYINSRLGLPYENGIGGLLELITVYLPLINFKTPEPHCTEEDAKCLQHFDLMLNVMPNKLPPAFWWGDRLRRIMNCRVGEPVKLK